MWIYEKKLQFPVDVRCADLRLAKALISQYGGPAGELSACLQYITGPVVTVGVAIKQTMVMQCIVTVQAGFFQFAQRSIFHCKRILQPEKMLLLIELSYDGNNE